MIRAVGVVGLFGGVWALLWWINPVWFRAELTGPIAIVWWCLLVVLPCGLVAAALMPQRLRTVRLIYEVPVEVHVHEHVHQHLHVTRVDLSQHVHLAGPWDLGRVGSSSRAALPSSRATLPASQQGVRVVPGEVVQLRELGR